MLIMACHLYTCDDAKVSALSVAAAAHASSEYTFEHSGFEAAMLLDDCAQKMLRL